MYLHLGQDVVVRSEDVIGIFDMENIDPRFTKEFLRQANRDIDVVTVSYEMPKSFILCGHGEQLTLDISQISRLLCASGLGRLLDETAGSW